MVRRSRFALLLVALVTAIGLVAGCVESSEEAAQTPSDAPTVANSALQTDSKGDTVTAPPAEVPADEEGTETGAGGGDIDGGIQVFETSCAGCHPSDGTAAGVGPQLSGMGLDEPTIENQIVNGGGAMPGGLVSGDDLTNVVAYVLSIQ